MLKFLRVHLCLLLLTLLATSALGQRKCPTTSLEKHSRFVMKHKKPAVNILAAHTTVAQMVEWLEPASLESAKVREANKPIDDRGTKAFELKGEVWRYVMEPNDCDFHLEIADPGGGKSAKRVIVEIPIDAFASVARKNFQKELASMKGNKLVNSKGEFIEPMNIDVKGVAFLDGAHFSNKHRKVGWRHGSDKVKTLWELHPVYDLQVLK